ncbi:hypothetical protein SprV_0702276600 [Sparganum proliferum]
MAAANHFDRDDVALPGFHKFFSKASEEEREHAIKNKRGGRIVLQDIAKPAVTEWSSGLEAMETALKIEREVNDSLLELHRIATAKDDSQFCDFLESEYLKEQVDSIKQISGYVTNLRNVGPGLGEYIFDKETLHGEDD